MMAMANALESIDQYGLMGMGCGALHEGRRIGEIKDGSRFREMAHSCDETA
jgi:hypothetical protein